MTTIIRLFLLVTLSTTMTSCGFFSTGSQRNDTPTIYSTSFSPTPKPLVTTTSTPTVTPTASITPSPANKPVCVALTSTTETNGWDCLNESYGFTVHFPSTAGISRTTESVVDVWLQNSLSNSRIDRMLSISLGKTAESCISSDAQKMQIGEQNFVVNHGFEPSGVVYVWKSYAITKESKSVCFMFIVGFQTWEQDDPLFPPEKDQGLDEVEAILATFRWLNP